MALIEADSAGDVPQRSLPISDDRLLVKWGRKSASCFSKIESVLRKGHDELSLLSRVVCAHVETNWTGGVQPRCTLPTTVEEKFGRGRKNLPTGEGGKEGR